MRKQMEDEKRRELSIMLFDLRQLEAKLHSLEHDLESCKQQMTADLEKQSLSMARIEVFASFIKRTASAIDAQKNLIHELHKRIEAKREELLLAIKERRAIESVKAKRLAEHEMAASRYEMKFIDEVAATMRINQGQLERC
ncbi:MAG: flagellar export protein FliJ [Candidatus Coatesbacteria bacterium]|nr:flagellar export protein FliJ [Candidatus Coatesbacteria bacterium]